jgi:HSP20 family protein
MNNRNLVTTGSPFLDLARRFFDDDFDFYPSVFEGRNNGLSNIAENENEYVVELTAPGLKKEDMKINLENDILTISSEIEDKKEETNAGYHRREFRKSSFSRSFSVPKNVNRDEISASMTDGILIVSLPKIKEEEKKSSLKITIK